MNSKLLLQIRNLTKSFGNRRVINSLNLHVMEGDIYGFLGRNGQGKTTAIRLVTELIFPDSGDVIIDGHHLRDDFMIAISHVGAIVESPSFYGYLSGYDNLKLMANLIPGIPKDRIDEVLGMVRLSHRAKDKVKTYSLGMKQRLGIANALLSSPKLIILDEPTNGLDPQGMKEMKEMIVQLAAERKITFFISSHLLHEVEQICNRVGIIHNGTLLCEATMDELAQTSNGKSLEEIYFDLTGEGGDWA